MVQKPSSSSHIDDESLARLNQAAQEAAADPESRARSGSANRRDVAFDAIYYYDRDHTRLFNTKIRTLWHNFNNDYIDNYEYLEEFTRVFVELGVVPNRHYRSAEDRYLLRLDGNYILKPKSIALLRALFSGHDVEVPVIQTVAAHDSAWQNNFSRGDLSVLDPASISRSAEVFELNSQELIEAVALHEATHDVLSRLVKPRKSVAISDRLSELSATTDGLLRFHHWLEVDEFLADAVQVQSNREGVRYVAARIVRAGLSLGAMREATNGRDRPHRKRAHDASALFFYRLLLRHETEKLRAADNTASPVDEPINRIRMSLTDAMTGNGIRSVVSEDWIRTIWTPYLNSTLDPELERIIQNRYRTVFQRIIAQLLE